MSESASQKQEEIRAQDVEYSASDIESFNPTVGDLVREQAEKLGTALTALRKIRQYADSLEEATTIAGEALDEIRRYGEDPENL